MDPEELGEPKISIKQFEAEEGFSRELSQHSGDCDIWLRYDPEDCSCSVGVQGTRDGREDGW